MPPEKVEPNCLVCQRNSEVTPLVPLRYVQSQLWICPEHLPVLIHDPARLVGLLPGAENLKPARTED